MIANVNNQITSIVSQSVARDEGKNRWLKSSCHYRVSFKVRLQKTGKIPLTDITRRTRKFRRYLFPELGLELQLTLCHGCWYNKV